MRPNLSRRALIKNICVTSAMTAMPIGIAFAAPAGRAAVGIVDSLLPGAAAMSARLRAETNSVHHFAGDPGQLWVNTIEPLLRVNRFAIAGYTNASTLFCLQYLGRDYGLGLEVLAPDDAPVDRSNEQSELLDLRDPQWAGERPAFSWLLAPQRG
jgi:hypothetical protein